jgi:5-methylcytosine-specific restriction endonuclease McrA
MNSNVNSTMTAKLNAIQKLSDTALLSETKKAVASERLILTEVLRHLREVDRRRLYSSLRYPSLFEYIVKELGYAEDAAYRRMNAMRLVQEMPELENKIATGKISLSNIGTVVQVIRAEAKSSGEKVQLERKLELISAVENKSRREAEQIVRQMTTAPKELLKPEKIRVIDDHVEIRMVGNKSLEQKIQKIKDILSHSHANISTADLFEKLCDDFLEAQDKKSTRAARKDISQKTEISNRAARKDFAGHAEVLSRVDRMDVAQKTEIPNRTDPTDFAQPVKTSNHAAGENLDRPSEISNRTARNLSSAKNANNNPNGQTQEVAKPNCDPIESESRRRENLPQSQASAVLPQSEVKAVRSLQHEIGISTSNRRYLSAELRRLIWARDQGRCHNCGSTRYIEIDHIIPISLGGSDEADNLRLLCRPCNQRSAIETLGQTKMQRYFEHTPSF